MYKLLDSILEATASDIQRKQKSIKRLFPDFDAKTRGVEDKGGIKLVDQGPSLWKFDLHSGTSDIWYDGYLHFKDVLSTIGELVRDKRLWVADKSKVDLKKLAKAFMDKVDIQLLCSCPADIFYGGHYIRSLGKYDSKYTKKEVRPPRVRNPKQYGCLCKHLDRLMHALPFYGSTCAKWLGDFYSKDIARFEKEVKKEYGWVKKAAAKLGRQREEKPEIEKSTEEPTAEKPREEERF